MTVFRSLALVCLGLAFCIGCGDLSSQSGEGGKSPAASHKDKAKSDDVADNDDASDGGNADSPHGMKAPHGMNPHGGMMPGAETGPVPENDGKLDLDNLHWTVPKPWVRKAPKSGMLLAEYAIPKAEGDPDDGRLTIMNAGGSLDDNIARWKGQFSKKLDKENKETIDAGDIKITLVDLSGTFDDSRGMMGPVVSRPDYRMLGAIFQLPGNNMLTFVKCYGPAKTMAARADEIKGFLRSLKADK
jgi:hypothetical protein